MSCNVRSHVSDILPGHKPATLKILFIEEMLEIQTWAKWEVKGFFLPDFLTFEYINIANESVKVKLKGITSMKKK